MKLRAAALALFPALVAVAAFWPALGNGLVWDDVDLTSGLLGRVEAKGAVAAILEPLSFSPNYFRPLGVATLVAELKAAGAVAPRWHHATNLVLHALNTLLVTLLAGSALRGTKGAGWIAAAAGLVFGLHGAMVEGVSFVACRFDLMCTLFMLFGFWADGAVRRTWLRCAFVFVAFLLAALTKEMAVTFPIVLVLLQIARGDPSLTLRERVLAKGNVATWVTAAVAGCVYLTLRHASLGYLLTEDPTAPIPVGGAAAHALVVAKSYGRYLFLAVWPFGTTTPIPWSELPVPVRDAQAWTSVGGLLVLAGTLVWGLRRWPREALILVAALVALLPVVNIKPLALAGGAYVADRFLMFPLTLLAIGATLALAKAFRGRAIIGVLAVVAWGVAGVVSIRATLPHWESDETLWEWGCEIAPNSPTPFTNLSLTRCYQGRPQEGFELAKRGTELDPEAATAFNNMGMALVHLDRWAESEVAFRRSLEIRPDAAYTWCNLGRVVTELGRLEEAERILLEEVLAREPEDGIGHVNLAVLYLRGNRPDLARPHLAKSLETLPQGQIEEPWVRSMLERTGAPIAWLKLGEAYVEAGQPDEALKTFAEAERLGASGADVAIGRGRALVGKGDLDGAMALLSRATTSFPQDARLPNNLGAIARAQNKLVKAREYFEEAVRLAPDWQLARENLETVKDAR